MSHESEGWLVFPSALSSQDGGLGQHYNRVKAETAGHLKHRLRNLNQSTQATFYYPQVLLIFKIVENGLDSCVGGLLQSDIAKWLCC